MPGLFRSLLTFGVSLVIEHEGVAAFLPEIFRERVTSPHRFQPRIFFDARLRDDRARIGLRRRARHGFTAAVTCALLIDRAAVVIVLQRKILPQTAGSSISSFSSTTRKNGFFASCLCSKDRDEHDHAEDRAGAGENASALKTASGRLR